MMFSILPNLLSNPSRQLALLAPAPDVFPSTFERVAVDMDAHEALMTKMQRLRGAVYLADGAIRPSELDLSGRHVMAADRHSFHLLVMSGEGRVVGCCRFYPHQPDVRFEDLAVSRSTLARDPIRGATLRTAVNRHIKSAADRGFLYVEVGGWALDASIRHSTEAVRIARLNFSLGLALGGAVGICTATQRNHSATILRRIGGRPLTLGDQEVPSYFDDQYGCEIEVMTFDSDLVPERHAPHIQELQETLHRTAVVCSQGTGSASLINLLRGVEHEALQSRAA